MNTAKILLSGVAVIASCFIAEAAQPTIVVTPGKMWATQKGYIIENVRNGKKTTRVDYDKAFVDPEFHNVQAAIQAAFSERGYKLPDAQASAEQDDEEEMYDEAFEGAQSGAGVQTNALDELMKTTKPDIRLEIDWNMNTAGSIYSCDFTIRALDAYSSKVIHSIAAQTGERRRTVPITVALKETTKQNMDELCDMMNTHFDDVEANGRETRLNVRIVDNGAGINMSTEFNDTELGEIIQNWMNDNTVNHQYSLRNSGRNQLSFDQVRIPLKDSRGRSLDAKGFAGQLQKYLKQFGLVCDIQNSSLGYGRMYIGEK